MKKLGFDLILLGSPVSGKDTQADLLMNYYALKPINAGAYLRSLRNNPRYKKMLSQTYDRGLPAPSKIVDEYIKKNVARVSKNKNLVFVGNPRLINEARLLKKLLDQKKRDFYAIYIRLSDKEVMRRSFHRDREQKDTDVAYIKSRINYHKKQVKETVDYFKKLHKLAYIDGNQSIVKVARAISHAIHAYERSKRT